MIDGRTSRGCLVLAAQIHGKAVQTIEGLSASGALAPLQQAFLTRNAAQCGFCTSGMLLTGYELISRGRPMSRDDIREYISGNMCRCTGYHAIVDAIESLIAPQAGRAELRGSDGPLPRLQAGRTASARASRAVNCRA